MKEYLAFYGQCYYPSAGMEDFIGDFDTIEEADKALEEANKKEWGITQPEWDISFGIVWSVSQRKNVINKGNHQ